MTQCREELHTTRCQLPGGHLGNHRAGNLTWFVPRWLQRVRDLPNGLAKDLTPKGVA